MQFHNASIKKLMLGHMGKEARIIFSTIYIYIIDYSFAAYKVAIFSLKVS